jgi:hypothetical protein
METLVIISVVLATVGAVLGAASFALILKLKR